MPLSDIRRRHSSESRHSNPLELLKTAKCTFSEISLPLAPEIPPKTHPLP